MVDLKGSVELSCQTRLTSAVTTTHCLMKSLFQPGLVAHTFNLCRGRWITESRAT